MEFLDLKTERENNSEIYFQAMNWLQTLTKETDFENGEKFAQFIERNSHQEKPLGAFVLMDSERVIGVISLVPDDQRVGEENNIPGIWIAGVQIHRDFRGKGYGKELFSYIDIYLKNIGNIQVNLFTNNPIAIKLYEQFGFQKTGLEINIKGEKETIFSKMY